MALAFQLKEAGFVADEMRTNATVLMDQAPGGFKISGIELVLNAKVPNVTNEKFQELAANAKANCPISQALASVPIKLTATLG